MAQYCCLADRKCDHAGNALDCAKHTGIECKAITRKEKENGQGIPTDRRHIGGNPRGI